jgi:Tfp pilus assembly protein PilV
MVMPKPGRNMAWRRGVMLADILVAVVLLGSALAVMIGMTGRAMLAQRTGEQLQIASNMLDEQLSLVLARGAENYASRFPVEGACEAPFEAFRYKLDISGGSGGSAFVVIATVTWVANGRIQSESVETRIAPRLGDDPDPDRRPSETVDRLQ